MIGPAASLTKPGMYGAAQPTFPKRMTKASVTAYLNFHLPYSLVCQLIYRGAQFWSLTAASQHVNVCDVFAWTSEFQPSSNGVEGCLVDKYENASQCATSCGQNTLQGWYLMAKRSQEKT